jgi:hypothetical protein
MAARVEPSAASLKTLFLHWASRGLRRFIAAFGFRFGDPFPLPLQHHLSLKLGDGPEHRQHEFASGRVGVEIEDADADPCGSNA